MLRPGFLVLFSLLLSWAVASAEAGGRRVVVVPTDGVAGDTPYFGNCTLCHGSFGIGQGDGSLQLLGVPDRYVPGQSYPLQVVIEDPHQIRWGFQLTAVLEDQRDAGSWVITDPVYTQSSNIYGRTYTKHTFAGSFLGVPDGPIQWDLSWVAPPAGSGKVRFFMSATASDGNDQPTGDYVYLDADSCVEDRVGHPRASLVLQPESIEIPRGSDLVVHANLRDHGVAGSPIALVSRVQLPGGAWYPAAGYLQAPIWWQPVLGQSFPVRLSHTIPVSAPLISATYVAWIGEAGGSALDRDAFVFNLLP
ncbi:MAG: hypothetical protein DWQ01_12290 [Planctomycetota bacterium]|nr:MAG: hypothetical protein DWQ01_12290 [Planctomycetota bacterium]